VEEEGYWKERKLWRMWDGMAGVENGEGEREERLAEVGFKRGVFMVKN
jgi:hypothetical protein